MSTTKEIVVFDCSCTDSLDLLGFPLPGERYDRPSWWKKENMRFEFFDVNHTPLLTRRAILTAIDLEGIHPNAEIWMNNGQSTVEDLQDKMWKLDIWA